MWVVMDWWEGPQFQEHNCAIEHLVTNLQVLWVLC
jgi:hypothetical protein